MSAYEGLLKEQLREEAGRRGLPVSGTNEELVARLEQHDLESDPLLEAAARENQAPAAPSQLSPASPATTTPPSVVPDVPGVSEAAPEATTGLFTTTFPCTGELSTGVHHENMERTYQQAVDAGFSPRGGVGGAHRIRFENDKNGRRVAVYGIHVRR